MSNNNKYSYFKERINYWIKYFGLLDWRVHFEVSEIDILAFAQTNSDYPGRSVTFVYNKQNDEHDFATLEQLDKTAFHEVIELMLDEVCDLAIMREFNPQFKDTYWSARHAFIRRLENTVYCDISNIKEV